MKTIRNQLNLLRDSSIGLGLIEIMVAMMLLALVVIAILPILITGLRASSNNATLATATGLVNQQMEDARSRSTCVALAAPEFTVTDTRGAVLKVTRTVVPCAPAVYPRAVPVTVTVTRVSTGVVVSSASTLVFVEGP